MEVEPPSETSIRGEMTKEIMVGDIRVGGKNPLILIAGPCVIEDEESAISHAKQIKQIAHKIGIPFIFKSSYDKANRTSIDSFRGPGIEKGLEILSRVKAELKVPILCDVHCRDEVARAAEVLDVIQIPALLSRQTDLIVCVSRTKKVVNIKKGQNLSPWDVRNVIEKVRRSGNDRILVTERGTSFGYNNLVSDMRSLKIMREFGYPVIYDAGHSVQLPGGEGSASGGEREFIPGLARAAVGMGCDGLFIEVHQNPDHAPCDGPNMLKMEDLEGLLLQVKEIDKLCR